MVTSGAVPGMSAREELVLMLNEYQRLAGARTAQRVSARPVDPMLDAVGVRISGTDCLIATIDLVALTRSSALLEVPWAPAWMLGLLAANERLVCAVQPAMFGLPVSGAETLHGCNWAVIRLPGGQLALPVERVHGIVRHVAASGPLDDPRACSRKVQDRDGTAWPLLDMDALLQRYLQHPSVCADEPE